MKTILKTTDSVKMSFAANLLEQAGVPHFVADQHVASIEGNIGAFPRRLMVAEEDAERAMAALQPLFEIDPDTGLKP